jgi:hypothetical protein
MPKPSCIKSIAKLGAKQEPCGFAASELNDFEQLDQRTARQSVKQVMNLL